MPSSTEAILATNRFGLGPRPGDLARIASDPRGAVLAQLADPAAARLEAPGLPTTEGALRSARLAELARNAERAAAPPPAAPGPQAGASPSATAGWASGGPPANAAKPMPAAATVKSAVPPVEADLFRAEATQRFGRLAETATPLLERLVMFWSNHFAVSETKGSSVKVSVGPMEREAIRPHVLGRFADMLQAVETHPAMLYYLDNHVSYGPRSVSGRNSRRGLNENLAREILELHTLGVDGGYGQADVTAFARVITGWTVSNPDDDLFAGGRFTFAPARHEPGPQEVFGRTYAEPDHRQGLAVLSDLARHPATARHLATKLARHFVADDPPPALVERLATVYLDTDGHLGEVTRALVSAPEAWAPEAAKVRPPYEFLVAMARALPKVPELGAVNGALTALGQPTWAPPGPDGWPDRVAAWMSPAGLATRLDIAVQFARYAGDRDPHALAAELWGEAVPAATREAVRRAESRQQGIAMLFAAPEFQRR